MVTAVSSSILVDFAADDDRVTLFVLVSTTLLALAGRQVDEVCSEASVGTITTQSNLTAQARCGCTTGSHVSAA